MVEDQGYKSDLPHVIDLDLEYFLRGEDTALDKVIQRVVDDLRCSGAELYSAHSTSPNTET